MVQTGSAWSVTDTDSIGSWIGREIEMVRTAHDAEIEELHRKVDAIKEEMARIYRKVEALEASIQ